MRSVRAQNYTSEMFLTYYVACFFVIAIAALFGMIVALLFGSASSLLSFIISKRKTKTSTSVRLGISASVGLGTSILVGVGVFLLVIFSVYGYWIYRANDFYGYGGDFDFYRIPLDYPYEMVMIDVTDCGHIGEWQDTGIIVAGVTHYHKRDNIIVGRISSNCFPADEFGWFSFDTTTGIAVEYRDEQEYYQTLKGLGFNEAPELLTLDENAGLYWDSYNETQR
jgi:hypothetical protein